MEMWHIMNSFFEDNKRLIAILVSIGVLVWSFFTLNCGLYVDENGLLTIYKGIYQGQHMFTDSWEALQTGGILTYPLLVLYYQVLAPLFAANGLKIGMVLYMRICYCICRLLVAVYLYLTIKRTDFEEGAFLSSLFYYMFVVGWRNFSYKSYCDMAVMLLICFLIRYHETKKNRYFVGVGIATCISIMAYPTMIFMAVFIGAVLIMEIYKSEVSPAALIIFVVTCLILGGAFLVYLQLTTGIGNAIAQIPNFGDQDYDNGLLYRLGMMLVSYLVLAAIAYLPIAFIVLFRKIRYVSDYAEGVLLTIYWILFFVGVCVVRIDSVSSSRFVYAILLLFFWFPYLIYEKKESGYTRIGAYKNVNNDENIVLWIIFAVSAVSQLIWAASTNQDITVPGHMAEFVVIADILIIMNLKEGFGGLLTAITLVAAFFMGFWVPEHNGGYEDVLSERYIVEDGELEGIALLPDDYYANLNCYKLVTEHVSADNKLLVAFGSNSTGYLNSDAWQGTYSVYARTQLNTKLLDYYQLNPNNQADYVLIDESNPKYETFREGETGLYILETYKNVVAQEGNFVLLSR